MILDIGEMRGCLLVGCGYVLVGKVRIVIDFVEIFVFNVLLFGSVD